MVNVRKVTKLFSHLSGLLFESKICTSYMTYNKNKTFYNWSVTHKHWFKKIIWGFRIVY